MPDTVEHIRQADQITLNQFYVKMKKLLRFLLSVPGTIRIFIIDSVSMFRKLRDMRNEDFTPF